MKNGRVIKGRVQALGSYREFGSGNCYEYATFVEPDGNIVRLTNVTAPPLINDFFNAGVEGEFYFHTYKKFATLLAMKKGDQKIFSKDDAKTIFKFYIGKFFLLLFFITLASLFLFMAIHDGNGAATLGGSVVMAFFVYWLYVHRIGAHYLLPNKAEQLVKDLGFN